MWNGTVVAESADTVVVEGNQYFPPESLRWEFFTASRSRSLCWWKGLASYYTIVAGGLFRPDGAWCYRRTSPLARRIKGRVAFAPDVEVVDGGGDRDGV